MFARRVLLPAALVMSALVISSGVPAWAEDLSSVVVSRVSDRSVEFVLGLPADAAPPPGGSMEAAVQIGSTTIPAAATVQLPKDEVSAVVLVIDASGSMSGARMRAARAAAEALLEQLPDRVDVGLVAVREQPVTLVAPGASRSDVVAALGDLRPEGGTALRDSMIQAMGLLPDDRGGRLIVLSDGEDTESQASAGVVVDEAKAADVGIDIVSLGRDPGLGNPLSELARMGTVTSVAEASSLIDRFRSLGAALTGPRVTLAVIVPPQVDASGEWATATVAWQTDRWSGRVRLPSDGALLAETGSSALSSAPDPGSPADLSSDRTPLPALVAALVIALATLAVGVAVGAAARSRGRRQRIQQVLDYSSSPGVERTVTRNSRVPRGARPSGTDSRVEQMLSGLSSELAAGAVSLSPAAWLGIQALIAVALIIVSVLVWGTVWLGLLALIGVPAVFTLSLRMRVERRQRAFADELPDFLLLLASALRAGLSFTQALESSADQNHGEVGRQIRRALAEAQVGSDLDSALMACAVRMDNEDLRWTVTALGLQREVGGNLSSILDGAAATIRERHALGREVRTLSAEGRLSAYVLMALPVGVFLFLLLFRREYVSQLWSSPLGIAMMVALVVLMLLGWIWMRAIVRIRV